MSKKIFRLIRLSLLAFLAILILMMLVGRLRVTDEQKNAAALLSVEARYDERENLAPYLWLFNYDIPDNRIDMIAASDAEKFNALDNSADIAAFVSGAKGIYPEIDYHKEKLRPYCRFEKGEASCLKQVRKDHDALKSLLAKSQKQIAKASHITDFRVHYSSMEVHTEGALPAFDSGRTLLKVHYANLFIDGQPSLAMEKVCGDIVAWRSIGAASDNLLGSMIGHAYVRQDLTLLAEMLAETPQEEALPENCKVALRPVEYSENMICEAIKGEYELLKNLDFRMSKSANEEQGVGRFITNQLLKLAYSRSHSTRKAAPVYAQACGNEAIAAAKQQRPVILDAGMNPVNHCDAFDWVADGIGCYFIEAALPDMKMYPGRRLDQAAQITTMQILLWLREQGAMPNTIEQIFRDRPQNLKAFSDRIHLDKPSGTLEVTLLSPSGNGDKSWSLSLSVAMPEKRMK